jgi:hypothetical protein
VIGCPPLLDGAIHDRFTCVGDIEVAESPVGEPGNVPIDDTVGVTVTSDDAMLVPTELIA